MNSCKLRTIFIVLILKNVLESKLESADFSLDLEFGGKVSIFAPMAGLIWITFPGLYFPF